MSGIGGAEVTNAETLGYLGLGMMGFPMTRRLLSAGHDVTVWNRSAGKATTLVEAGAKPASCPRGVADAASSIFMCLPDAAAVQEEGVGAEDLAPAGGVGGTHGAGSARATGPQAGARGLRGWLSRRAPLAIVRAAHGEGPPRPAARPYRHHAQRPRHGDRRRARHIEPGTYGGPR